MAYLDEIYGVRDEFEAETARYKTNLDNEIRELMHLYEVARNTPYYLQKLDEVFSKKTSLNFKDIKFLFAATALQCIRIYVINELTDVEKAGAGNKTEDALHKFQDKIFSNFSDNGTGMNSSYHASLSHIITARGVPYDATAFADVKYDFFKGANHRFATYGHDPIIGLVIGTTNILTNTITVKTSNTIPIPITCHVEYDMEGKNPKIGIPGSTLAALNAAAGRVDGDIQSIVAALVKQVIHIGTDLYTPTGIQLPGANIVLSSSYTEQLTKYVSTGDVIKFGASYKMFNLINTIIGTLHMMTCPSKDKEEMDLYHVKTMKILEYSNIIATGSNVIFNAIRIYLGDKKAIKKIDFAGLFGTIMMIINNAETKRKIKEEYIFGHYNQMITERKYQLTGDYGV